MSGYSIGIDLGTTFTAAAINRAGTIYMAPLGRRQPEMPSVVAVQNGDVIVGDAAERLALSQPEAIAREFKRRIGDTTPLLLQGTPWSAEALTSHLLTHVLDHAKQTEGSTPDTVVITHPANWHEFKLDRLRQAAMLAGCEDATFVPEPVAAAQFYASQQRISTGQTVAVFDLGGGTFDAAVLTGTPTGFDLLGQPKGLEQLGGIDLDQAVFGHVLNALDIDLAGLDDTPENQRSVHRLRLDCREAKEHLSTDTAVSVPVMLPGVHTEIRITRQEFENMIRLLLEKAIRTLGSTIEASGTALETVDGILLVGGSSRIPLVAQMIGEELRTPVLADAHPKHTIASGAALDSSGLFEEQTQLSPRSPTVARQTNPQADRTENPGVLPTATPARNPQPASKPSVPAEPERAPPPPEAQPLGNPAPLASGSTSADPSESLQRKARTATPASTTKQEEGNRLTQSKPFDPAGDRRRRRLIIAGIAAAASVGSLGFAGLRTLSQSSLSQSSTSVTPLPDVAVLSTINVGGRPGTILFDGTFLWVPDKNGRRVLRIDPQANSIAAKIDLPGLPESPIAAEGSVWIAYNTAEAGGLVRIDAKDDSIQADLTLGRGAGDPLFAEGSIWVTSFDERQLARVNPSTNTIEAAIPTGAGPSLAVAGGGSIWVLNTGSGDITRVSSETNQVLATIQAGGQATPVFADNSLLLPGSGGVYSIDLGANAVDGAIASFSPDSGPFASPAGMEGESQTLVTEEALWINGEFGAWRVSLDTGELVELMGGGGSTMPVFFDGSVWISDRYDSVGRFDSGTGAVIQEVSVAGGPQGPVIADDALWLSNAEAGLVTRIQLSPTSLDN